MTRWVYISLSYATFIVAIRDGVIVDGPPIARWALGKDERFVADFYRRKGARFVGLGIEEDF